MPGELKVKPGRETQTSAEGSASPGDKDKDKEEEKEPPPSVTEHTLTVGGKTIHYRATAGYMVMRDWSEKKKSEEGEGEKGREPSQSATPAKEGDKSKDKDKDKDEPKQKAKVFYIAYTRTDTGNDPSKRPITFSFNGGPGSASVWLHMGALGPRRTELTERGEAPLAPYHLVDNEATWLDATDLVFIDPVSTGYSRSVPGEDPKQFHGFKEDLASVGDFIRLYTSRNTRWASPKFIIGESYGTTRAAGLSDYLQERYGFYVNGIILVSSVLDFSSIRFAPGNDRPYPLFLPTYTAAAWYHKKLPPDLQNKPLADVVHESENFASNQYLLALESRRSARRESAQRTCRAISPGSRACRQRRSRNGISGFPRGGSFSICSRTGTVPSGATTRVSPGFVTNRARRTTISIRATKRCWVLTARR